jgi:hypothetical protein
LMFLNIFLSLSFSLCVFKFYVSVFISLLRCSHSIQTLLQLFSLPLSLSTIFFTSVSFYYFLYLCLFLLYSLLLSLSTIFFTSVSFYYFLASVSFYSFLASVSFYYFLASVSFYSFLAFVSLSLTLCLCPSFCCWNTHTKTDIFWSD